jgi:hypothetical protein
MHEMMVTSSCSEVDPSGIAQLSDDRPAVHRGDDVGGRAGRQAMRAVKVRR